MTWKLALLCVLLTAGVAHADWDTETPMTSTGTDVWGEGIASSGSTVHMIYGTNEIRYRSSPDEGKTWSNDRQLDTGVLHLTDPMIADGNDVSGCGCTTQGSEPAPALPFVLVAIALGWRRRGSA